MPHAVGEEVHDGNGRAGHDVIFLRVHAGSHCGAECGVRVCDQLLLEHLLRYVFLLPRLLLSFATSSSLSLPFAFSLFRSLFSSLVLSPAPPVLLSFHPRPPLQVAACVPDAILKRTHQTDTKLATLYAYTPEVLPSAHRGTGNGIAIGWNRIMGILSAVIATVADVSFLLPRPQETQKLTTPDLHARAHLHLRSAVHFHGGDCGRLPVRAVWEAQFVRTSRWEGRWWC